MFLLVGGATALVYFGRLALLLDVARIDYRIGASIAYVMAVSFHFLANRHLTFRSREESLPHQLARYLSLVGFNYVIMLAIVSFAVAILGWNAYGGSVVAIAVTTCVGYLLSRVWVFRKKHISG
ncbi:MAG: GtrA family protein [Usitatibacter sp.]